MTNSTTIKPFRGLRYAGERPDLTGLLAPPYDVVNVETQRALIKRNRHNVLAIDNPASGITDPALLEQAYQAAAGRLDAWISEDVLRTDNEPSFYVIRHDFRPPEGGPELTRTGIMAVLPALPWTEAAVKPHERTFAGPKQDRLQLMRATETQTSPIFVMWDGASNVEEILDSVMTREYTASGEISGEFGPERLTLWRVSEPSTVSALEQALAGAELYIADGHHRYETAVAFGQEASREGRSPAVLAYLSAARDPGLRVLPTHRILKLDGPAPSAEAVLSRLPAGWRSERYVGEGDPESLLVPAGPDRHSFAVVTAGDMWVMRRPMTGTSPPERLDVDVLHQELLPAWDPTGTARIVFTRDAESAVALARSGSGEIAFIMAPPSVDDVIRVSDAGETMPQKSTYFYPKVPTGLVMHRVD